MSVYMGIGIVSGIVWNKFSLGFRPKHPANGRRPARRLDRPHHVEVGQASDTKMLWTETSPNFCFPGLSYTQQSTWSNPFVLHGNSSSSWLVHVKTTLTSVWLTIHKEVTFWGFVAKIGCCTSSNILYMLYFNLFFFFISALKKKKGQDVMYPDFTRETISCCVILNASGLSICSLLPSFWFCPSPVKQ